MTPQTSRSVLVIIILEILGVPTRLELQAHHTKVLVAPIVPYAKVDMPIKVVLPSNSQSMTVSESSQ